MRPASVSIDMDQPEVELGEDELEVEVDVVNAEDAVQAVRSSFRHDLLPLEADPNLL
jgi:hypothetical protein